MGSFVDPLRIEQNSRKKAFRQNKRGKGSKSKHFAREGGEEGFR
jgi:hypothetical protein